MYIISYIRCIISSLIYSESRATVDDFGSTGTFIQHIYLHFSSSPQNGDLDFKNIDPEFVREPVPNSVGKSCTANISASVQEADNAFMGFTYVPPTDLE